MVSNIGLQLIKQAYAASQYPMYPMYQQSAPPAISISYSNMPQHGNYMYNYRNWNNQGANNPFGVSDREWQWQIEQARKRAEEIYRERQMRVQAQQQAVAQARQQRPALRNAGLFDAATGRAVAAESQENARRFVQGVKGMMTQKQQPAPVKTAALTIKEAAFLGTAGKLIGQGLSRINPGVHMAFNTAKKFMQPYASKAMNMVQPYASKAYNTVQPYAQQAMNRVTGFAKNGINDLRTGFNQGFARPQVQGSLLNL